MPPQFSCVPLRSTSENCAVLPCFSDFGCFPTAHFLTFPSPGLWGIPFEIHTRGIYKPFPRRSTTLQNHVDNFKTLNYTEYRNKGATGRRLAPYWITEVTAGREAGRLLLFMSLYEKADNANDQNTDLNQIRVCNHCQPPCRKIRGPRSAP